MYKFFLKWIAGITFLLALFVGPAVAFAYAGFSMGAIGTTASAILNGGDEMISNFRGGQKMYGDNGDGLFGLQEQPRREHRGNGGGGRQG